MPSVHSTTMDCLPRTQSRADLRAGGGSLSWRRLLSARHRRSVLTVCAAVLAVLCVLSARRAAQPPALPIPATPLPPTDVSTVPPISAAVPPVAANTATHGPDYGQASASVHSTHSTSSSGDSSTSSGEVVSSTAVSGSEGTAELAAVPAGVAGGAAAEAAAAGGPTNLSRLSPIADADSTGSRRSDAEARAYDTAACAFSKSGAPTHAMRIRHSADRAVEFPEPGDVEDAWDPEALREIDPMTYQFPFRVPEVPGARTYGEVQWCPGSLEPPPEAVPPVDPAYRALFLIGAQKAGTSWLHAALATQPVVVYGQSAVDNKLNKHRKQDRVKELQFFNTWPAGSTEEFLAMWPPDELAAMRNGTSQKFLFDGSPEYLLNAAVAPRLKQMVPQAKIMIVLRDPTDRAFSAWGMRSGWGHLCDADDVPLSQMCVERSFEDTFNAWHNSFARPECRFTTPGSGVSWGECYGCRYNLFRFKKCCQMRQEGQEGMLPCFGVPRGFSVLDYSAYAAQLAWWLEFFPPEQIFVVTSETLHDETQRVEVLNDLLDFVGLPDVPRFYAEQVNAAAAFNGRYSNISDADVAAKATVRRFHAPQVRDLHALLSRFWPYVDTSALAQWPKADTRPPEFALGPL